MVERKKIEIEKKDPAGDIIMEMAWKDFDNARESRSFSKEGVEGFIDTEEGKVKLHFKYCPEEDVDEVIPPGIFTVEIGDMKVELKVKFKGLRIFPYKGTNEEVDKVLEILRSLKPYDIVFPHKEEAGK